MAFRASLFTMVRAQRLSVSDNHTYHIFGCADNQVAGAGIPPNDAKDPFSSIPLTNFTRDLAINTTSVFVAAQQAVLGFKQLPPTASKTFIFTGNILNVTTIASLLNSGVGKSATAHIIQSASIAYKDQGYKYVDMITHCS